MGGVCTLIRETGPNDSWVHEENATMTFESGLRMLVSEFESSILSKNACKSSWSKFDPGTQASLTTAYLILIVFGSLGNGLVCYVVLANCHMRTPRNLLILNLATSDLILCLFTQPFNLLKASAASWKLGTSMCKLVPMVAGTNVFVSTFSITAIALDRFKLIVRPTDRDLLLQPVWSAAVLVSIWLLSLVLSSPMLVFNTLHHIKATEWLCVYEFCIEDPEYSDWKTAYSIASMLIQYILPIMVLSVAHARICNKLRNRMAVGGVQQSQSSRLQEASRPIKQRLLLFPWTSSVPAACDRSQGKEQEEEKESTPGDRNTESSHSKTVKCESSETPFAPVVAPQTPIVTSPPEDTLRLDHPENVDGIQHLPPTSDPTPASTSSTPSLRTRVHRMVRGFSPSKRLWMCRSKPARDDEARGKGRNLKARKRRADRERKTNRLLMMIAVVFAGSWMPLNIINIVADLDPDLITSFDETGVVFAVCHLLVLGSACANPVLYGWLNENFQREFKRILCVQCGRRQGPILKSCCGRWSIREVDSRPRVKIADRLNASSPASVKVKRAVLASGPRSVQDN